MGIFALTPEERSLLPGEEEVRAYEEHGWWVSPPCLDQEALDQIRFGIERYYAGERDWALSVPAGADWEPVDGDVVRQNDFASLQVEELHAFLRRPLLAAMAARLARSPSIRLFHDQIIYKPPGRPLQSSGVGWHTDRAYWKTCTSERMLTAWIPLADVDEESGTMLVIDRSHLWPDAELHRHFHVRDVEEVRHSIVLHGEWNEVPYRLQAGQVAFHHCRTIHGSRENRGTEPRIAWAIHFQAADNRWQPVRKEDGTLSPHVNDLLCRRLPGGAPDYQDPEVCPELWKEDES